MVSYRILVLMVLLLLTASSRSFASDLAKIEQNQGFDPLRNEAGYKKLVSGLKKGT